QQKVKIRRAWSRRMAASFSPGFACSKSRNWVSRRSLEVPAWPDAFFLAIPAQSVRHQSAARDHREAVRFRADSKGKSVDGEAHRDGGYTGNPPPYPLVHECRSRDLVIVLLLPLSRPATPTTAEAIRSRLTEIHFNTTFLTEMRDLALSRRAARRATLFRGRLEQRLLDLHLHLLE